MACSTAVTPSPVAADGEPDGGQDAAPGGQDAAAGGQDAAAGGHDAGSEADSSTSDSGGCSIDAGGSGDGGLILGATSVITVQDWPAIFNAGAKFALVRGNDSLTRKQLDQIRPEIDARPDTFYGVFIIFNPTDIPAQVAMLWTLVGNHADHPRWVVNIDTEGSASPSQWNQATALIAQRIGYHRLGVYAGSGLIGLGDPTPAQLPDMAQTGQFHRPAYGNPNPTLPRLFAGRMDFRQSCCAGVGDGPCSIGPFNKHCVTQFTGKLPNNHKRTYVEWFNATFGCTQ